MTDGPESAQPLFSSYSGDQLYISDSALDAGDLEICPTPHTSAPSSQGEDSDRQAWLVGVMSVTEQGYDYCPLPPVDPYGGRVAATHGRVEGKPAGSLPSSPSLDEYAATDRQRWLDAVEESTREYRRRRAEHLRACAEAIRRASPVFGDRIGVVSVTDDGYQVCPLPPDDTRAATDGDETERWPGQPAKTVCQDTRWYETRASAQEEKIDRVKRCGTDTIVRSCQDCGSCKTAAVRCRDFRLCLDCRSSRIAEYRNRFEHSHLATVEHGRSIGLEINATRHGGRWAAKFVTLTIPHQGILVDMEQFPRAWPKFVQRIKQHLVGTRFYPHERGPECRDDTCTNCEKAKALLGEFKFVRVLEVTPGGNGMEPDPELRAAMGHVHMHVYMYAPYIDQALLAQWWGSSLTETYRDLVPTMAVEDYLEAAEGNRAERLRPLLVARRGASKPLERIYRPHVDIRACTGSARDIATEFAKYLVKDGERNAAGELQYVDPWWFATVYEALGARRSIAACRYFWLLAQREPRSVRCDDCGGWHITTSFDREITEARGPPARRH